MEIEDIPAAVPDVVRRMAVVYWQSCHPLMRKALAAPAMDRVWSYFETRPVENDFLSRIEFVPDLRSVDLGWSESAVSEQAMACLFFAILIACTRTSQVVYSDIIDAEIGKLDETIKRVEALRNFAPDPVTPLPASVDRAIDEIVEHCKSRKSLLDYSGKPAILKRPGKNDIVRAFVRELGTSTFILYGQCCYGQLATIANVMFTLDPPVTERSTEKWCTSPPLPSVTVSKREPPIGNKS